MLGVNSRRPDPARWYPPLTHCPLCNRRKLNGTGVSPCESSWENVKRYTTISGPYSGYDGYDLNGLCLTTLGLPQLRRHAEVC